MMQGESERCGPRRANFRGAPAAESGPGHKLAVTTDHASLPAAYPESRALRASRTAATRVAVVSPVSWVQFINCKLVQSVNRTLPLPEVILRRGDYLFRSLFRSEEPGKVSDF